MAAEQKSPRILELKWGHLLVDGLDSGKDFKLYPGGGRPWDWNESGTRHHPGIQPSDVEDLIANGATVIVLSRGMELQLEIDPATLQLLEDRNVPVHVLETREAAALYNELAENSPVGGLFHSTC